MKLKIVFSAVVCLVSLWASTQDAPDASTASKIQTLEHVWGEAQGKKDLKALDAIFDNALIFVDPEGTLMTKAELLARVRAAPLQRFVMESMMVRIFGITAMVTGVYRSTEMQGGKVLQRRVRFLDTWSYQDGRWICVAAQATPITVPR